MRKKMNTDERSQTESKLNIPATDSRMRITDILGAWRVRWGIGRNRYRVESGLYALGIPDERSPVLVTANYKLTFDTLRKELGSRSVWILVLDTRGINVWCAAGKGAFGTAELIRQINRTNLVKAVEHRTLVIPQLGAPGIAAHEVRRLSGFRVVYGPVRAADLPEYLDRGMEATPEMRRVTFRLWDRLRVTPVELVQAVKWLPAVFALLLAFYAITGSADPPLSAAFGFIPFAGAVFVGTILFPLLLPCLPGRAFSLKGWFLGIVYSAVVVLSLPVDWLAGAGLVLLLSAIVAFLALNFTGASTFTSLSGVKKEMRTYIPAMATAAAAGLFLTIMGIL
jgi:hypothetical protein